jgi:hypothetical protein
VTSGEKESGKGIYTESGENTEDTEDTEKRKNSTARNGCATKAEESGWINF